MKIAVLALLPLLFGGAFRACVHDRSAASAQADPGAFSRGADQSWRYVGRALIREAQRLHEELRPAIERAARELPQGAVDVPEEEEGELAVEGNYGRLPEVVVDSGTGTVFPVPVSPPHRYSWIQVSIDAREALREFRKVRKNLARWRAMSSGDRVRAFNALLGEWNRAGAQLAALAAQERYLETWIPQLERAWIEARAKGDLPIQYRLTRALQMGDPDLMEPLREILKPRRVLKRAFLPDSLDDTEAGLIEIPIVTDITSRKFLAEVEGALATHWNQSPWARRNGILFRIRWSFVPKDTPFAEGKTTLAQHLERFPRDKAAMTTGGLTTYVRQQALVFGPGRINPRTLAHELGHLLGFGDCYLRTLSGQGVFGVAVLEWDNPLYPDDLMCDNSVGVARAEVW